MLRLTVNGQKLSLVNAVFVAADSVDYLKARFLFSEDWNNLAKIAVFKDASKENVYHVLLDNNGECTVPWQVIKAPEFYVSVFAGNRITANDVRVECNVSGYAEGIYSEEDPEETFVDIRAHKEAEELDHPDGSVTTAKLAEDSVTNSKIANGAVTASCIGNAQVITDHIRSKNVTIDKLADGVLTKENVGLDKVDNTSDSEKSVAYAQNAENAVNAESAEAVEWNNIKNKPTEFTPASHTHDTYTKAETDEMLSDKENKNHTHSEFYTKTEIDTLIDNVSSGTGESSSGSGVETDIVPLALSSFSEYGETYDFPYTINEKFAVTNDLDENVSYVLTGGDPVWNFSQTLEVGKSYLCYISEMPVSGADWNNGTIVVAGEISQNSVAISQLTERVSDCEDLIDDLDVRLISLANTVNNSNSALETMLMEGV